MMTSTCLASRENKLRAQSQEAILVGHDQPTDPVGQDAIEQSLEAFLVVIHPRPEVGHDLKLPALAGTVRFQYLLLPVHILFLVMARDPRMGDRFTSRVVTTKRLRSQSRQIIAPVASDRAFVRPELGFALLPAQCGRVDAQKLCRFTDSYEFSIHAWLHYTNRRNNEQSFRELLKPLGSLRCS